MKNRRERKSKLNTLKGGRKNSRVRAGKGEKERDLFIHPSEEKRTGKKSSHIGRKMQL